MKGVALMMLDHTFDCDFRFLTMLNNKSHKDLYMDSDMADMGS